MNRPDRTHAGRPGPGWAAARVLIFVTLAASVSCGDVRTIDIRGVQGPALAFALGMEQGLPVSVSPAIMLDDDGNVTLAPGELPAEGSSTRLLIIKNSDLLTAAASFGKHVMQDDLHIARLVVRGPSETRAVERDGRTWLALAVPSEAIQRPPSDDPSLRTHLELEIPMRSNHQCRFGGSIRDFGAGYVSERSILDMVVLDGGRLVASNGRFLSLVQAGDLINLSQESDPRVFALLDEGLYFQSIEQVPGPPNEIWVAATNPEGRGELMRLRVTDRFEILERVDITTIGPIGLGVSRQGVVAMSGPLVGAPNYGVVYYAQGALTTVPTMTEKLSKDILSQADSNTFVVGTRGAALRQQFGDSEWTRSNLQHRDGPPFPATMAHRREGENLRLFVAGDDGVMISQAGNEPSHTIKLVGPPGYRCHEEGSIASLNFHTMAIYKDRFALLGMGRCSDIFVVDLEDPKCLSFIPYDGEGERSSSPEKMQLDGDRLWIVGRRGLLRYVDLGEP